MGKKLFKNLSFLFCFVFVSFCFGSEAVPAQSNSPKQVNGGAHIFTPKKVRGFFRKLFVDSYKIGENLFTQKTMKVVAGTLPFYLVGRQADATVHRQFYDAENHRNRNQPPRWLKNLLIDEVMAIPFAIYGVYGWFNVDAKKRREAQVFSVGLLWTWSTKILLKEIKSDSGLRPWHEEYDRHERAHGGNPSGHSSMASFFATYLWLAKGPKYGVPLSLYAGLIASLSTAANHHYLSQVFAGLGLGAMMGVASYGALQDVCMPENLEVGLTSDHRGGVGLRVAYAF